MRILLTLHAFPPRSTAGVEVYTLRLARALQGLGHEVLVLSAVHDLAAQPYQVRRREQQGVPVAEVVSVHPRGTLAASYDDPDLTAAVRPVIRRFGPDGVHVQHLLNLSVGVLEESRSLGAAVVITLHDHWLSCPRDGLRLRADLQRCDVVDHAVCARCLRDSPYLVPPVQTGLVGAARRVGLGRQLHRLHDLAPRTIERGLRLLRELSSPHEDLAAAMDRRASRLREAVARADVVLAPTRFVRERALEFGLPQSLLRVAALGALTSPPRPRAAGPRRRFGFLGTLAPHKGVHVLIEAFRGLVAPGASLDLFGSPSAHPGYADSLRHAARDDPRIRFRGAFPEGGQAGVLGELDAVVLPSLWWETTGLVLLEALAAGVPVIASDLGGVPEVVSHGTTGLLVPSGDSAALRRAMDDLAAGRRLAEPHPPLPLKTVEEGACELQELYASQRRRGIEAAR